MLVYVFKILIFYFGLIFFDIFINIIFILGSCYYLKKNKNRGFFLWFFFVYFFKRVEYGIIIFLNKSEMRLGYMVKKNILIYECVLLD